MTAMGVGLLAGIGCGFYGSVSEVRSLYRPRGSYGPKMSVEEAKAKMDGYRAAVRMALNT